MNNLADRLQYALKARQKSAAELSKATGASESAVSQWLSGLTRSLRTPNLMAASEFLGCNAAWLANGTGPVWADSPSMGFSEQEFHDAVTEMGVVLNRVLEPGSSRSFGPEWLSNALGTERSYRPTWTFKTVDGGIAYLGFENSELPHWSKLAAVQAKHYAEFVLVDANDPREHLERIFDMAEVLPLPQAPAGTPYPADPRNPASDLVITQYDAGGSMGTGVELEEKQPGTIKSWKVDQEWLRLNVKHYSGLSNLCIVTGFGPSMQPKYNPGDPLLMDRGITTVETEGIYFFRVANHGYIKQLQRIPTEDGLIIRAKSLNKDYDPFDITKKMDFEVFGKILTVWRSEQV